MEYEGRERRRKKEREKRIGSEKGRKIYRKIDFELISYKVLRMN